MILDTLNYSAKFCFTLLLFSLNSFARDWGQGKIPNKNDINV